MIQWITEAQRLAFIVARLLVAVCFLLNGSGFISQALAAKDLLDSGTPARFVPKMMAAARTIEVVGGLALSLGVFPELGSIALIAFLVPATLVGHPFWQATDERSRTLQFINFTKNVTMIGGLLFITVCTEQPVIVSSVGLLKLSNGLTPRSVALRKHCGGGSKIEAGCGHSLSWLLEPRGRFEMDRCSVFSSPSDLRCTLGRGDERGLRYGRTLKLASGCLPPVPRKVLVLAKRNELYSDQARFWMRIFAVKCAMESRNRHPYGIPIRHELGRVFGTAGGVCQFC